MLTPELLETLQSPAGRELLRRAAELEADPFAAQKLRPLAAPDLCAAAVDQVRLRERAAAKFPRAAEMWFSAPLLEQSSGEVIAAHRARRYQGYAVVADLCAGLGGDALELARYAAVLAVDRDPLALALTRANCRALETRCPVTTVAADLPAGAPEAEAAWADPGRREGGRRTRRLDQVSPSVGDLLTLLPHYGGLGIKLSPATDHGELDQALGTQQHEREAISVQGECRELVAWLGELSSAPRRATLLPGGDTLAGEPRPLPPPAPPGAYLLEPDAAVLRVGLVGNLAAELDAWPLDPQLAYLSSQRPITTPFARAYRIQQAEPFSARRLADLLRERRAGDVVLKTRGFAGTPETLRRSLRAVLKQGEPGTAPVVFITRLAERAVMMLGERLGAGTDESD